jgi:hypothetical protein
MAGGIMGVLLAPVMVTVKYMTGWAIIPEPVWVRPARQLFGGLLQFAPPPGLWVTYGTLYTAALCLMLVGLIGLGGWMRDDRGRIHTRGFWIVLAGLCMVVPGDAIHTWTWHRGGLTTPTPGTNPVANTAYAVHMMGMNLVMVGTIVMGVSSLRRKFLARWLAWAFAMVFPAAIVASLTFLPTTPSGALWLFSLIMIACGYSLVRGESHRLIAPSPAPESGVASPGIP